jgi:hypothetical protein
MQRSRLRHLKLGRLMQENMQLNWNILTKISAQEWKESYITFEDYVRIISYFFVYNNFALCPSLGLFLYFSSSILLLKLSLYKGTSVLFCKAV